MSGWQQFAVAIFALVIVDHGIANVCRAFGAHWKKS